ncbi:MAG TPA: nucleoside 2-deoxyribosyltransferase [Dissulfurispiraceae bacterium]|nr:nucleoside 2-deoxyribosyltransferase [Dissulfurispiraceae bacterium]
MAESTTGIHRIYVAGPLYNAGERWYLECVDQVCRDMGYDTFLPHRDAGLCPSSGDGGGALYVADKENLDTVDMVVAVLNGSSIDSGTAWEIGYAHARRCRVIGLYDDTRVDDPQSNINLMIYHSVELCNSLEGLKEKLRVTRRGAREEGIHRDE